MVRYLPDGNIEFLGRCDHQVKIRGFRIELGELEAVLIHHPAVREAIVLAREDVPGDKRLVAYVVLHEKQGTTVGDLRNHVMKYLPNYMLPSAFVLLEALPLLTSGKVDRDALPVPDAVRLELQEAFVAPRTKLEEQVASIWSQILRIEQVGIHDNFFVLGGHSLLATQVLAHIRATLHVELSLRRFFEAPTVAQLAETISQQKTLGRESQTPTLGAISREAYRIKLSSMPSNSGGSRSAKERTAQ
jgi:acyl carrier protein